jgi:hypothetical protein
MFCYPFLWGPSYSVGGVIVTLDCLSRPLLRCHCWFDSRACWHDVNQINTQFPTYVRIQLYVNCNWCKLEFTPPPPLLFIKPNQLCICFYNVGIHVSNVVSVTFYNVSIHVSNVVSVTFFHMKKESKIHLIITVLVINNSKIVVCVVLINYINNYRISRPIRRTYFTEKCDLNLTCVLCAEGKHYFQTYKYPYSYYITSLSCDSEICFQIMRSGITACERLTFL